MRKGLNIFKIKLKPQEKKKAYFHHDGSRGPGAKNVSTFFFFFFVECACAII